MYSVCLCVHVCLQYVGCPALSFCFIPLKEGFTEPTAHCLKLAGQWVPVIFGISPSPPLHQQWAWELMLVL